MRPSKLRVPLEPAGRAGSPVTAKARCALAPRLAGSSTSASAVHAEARCRSCACGTLSVRGSGAPARGQRSVPPWMSMRPSRQRDNNRAPALGAGSCPAPPARAPAIPAPAPRSMSGFTSVMRPAPTPPLRAQPLLRRQGQPARQQALLALHALLMPLDEYDVVVIGAVEGLDLQADRTTDLRLQLPEGGGLLVQEAIHDVLVSEYQQLTTGKLSALSHNFPKNLVAHRFRRADETAPRAAWTRLTQQMFQALAGALAGHFH